MLSPVYGLRRLVRNVAVFDRCDKMAAMAKKKQSKKHRFKYTEPSVAAGLQAAGGRLSESHVQAAATAGKVTADQSAGLAVGVRDFSYVGTDVRRIAMLAVWLVALEAILWYVFTHTGVGASFYSSFSI